MTRTSDDAIAATLRALTPAVLGVVVRRFRDFAASEDAVQEASIAAASRWPVEGMPDEPAAWLVRVASRRMVDHVREETARRRREDVVVSLVPPEEQLVLDAFDTSRGHDDTLVLLFMCCHRALTSASAIALTLRAVGGLTTAEIARAFLVPEATMAQRIARAKKTLATSDVPFALPSAEETAPRLRDVLHVLYLIFNEGYTASSGPSLQRSDLAHEAIRLARILAGLVPEVPEATALLALLLLTDARRNARTGAGGALVPLDEQDRTLWDRAAIDEGVRLVTQVFTSGPPGPYAVQAAIAAVHDEAPSAEGTDWAEIRALYEVLLAFGDDPMARLSHAVAVAMVEGPDAGLARVDALASDPRLANHHRIEAVRAHLLERRGDHDAAADAYADAAAKTASTPERDYLLLRAAGVRSRPRG
ncbi:MAG: DUF6596 domain-containing protein [Polyangiaceae bacterium]